MEHGPVDHVLAGFAVEDGLWRPHTAQVALSLVALLDVDDGVCPVHQVSGLQQDHGAVGRPAVARHHVGDDHVERPSVFSTQDVRVTHTAGRTDEAGVKHRLVAVERTVGVAVEADGKVDGLFCHAVAREVGEQVSDVVLLLEVVSAPYHARHQPGEQQGSQKCFFHSDSFYTAFISDDLCKYTASAANNTDGIRANVPRYSGKTTLFNVPLPPYG